MSERRGSRVGRPYAARARRLTHHESPSRSNSGWVPVGFGSSRSGRHIPGGHLLSGEGGHYLARREPPSRSTSA